VLTVYKDPSRFYDYSISSSKIISKTKSQFRAYIVLAQKIPSSTTRNFKHSQLIFSWPYL